MFWTDFTSAKLGDDTVYFSAAESRLLEVLSRNAGRTLTRGQIIDAISGDSSEKTDRSVDFLVNRIRRKLGDDARNPRFIGTRYGGGYVWLGPPAPGPSAVQATEADIMVGPLRGLDLLGSQKAAGLAFAQYLAEALGVDGGGTVTVEADLNPASSARVEPALFTVELSFFRDGEAPGCVMSCRSSLSKQVFFVQRLSLMRESAPYPSSKRTAENLVPDILAARWRVDVDHMASSEPLPVAMQNATFNNSDAPVSWQDNDVQLAKLRADRPDDPVLALIYAHHLHTKIVISGHKTFRSGLDESLEIDGEIERLVQSALITCQDNPDLAIIAAKLLYYVDRRYKTLALELAHKANDSGTAVATSMAILGQLLAFTGDIDAAVDLLRQAETLAAPKSRFRHYVHFFLCQALVAGGRRAELEPVRAELYAFHPLARLFYEPFMTDPDQPSLRARAAMLSMSKARARATLSYGHRISGGLFERAEHRANSMRAPVKLCVRRFGRSVVPEEVAVSVPSLLG